MSENENPSDICPFSKSEEDYSRSWRPWELDFLIDLRGDMPPESWLKMFSQLMRWWNFSYHGLLAAHKKDNNFRDMERIPLECYRSVSQLTSVWLGTLGEQQAGGALRDLERLGVFTSKRAGIGQPTSRVMNRPLIEAHYKRWITDKGTRHFELKKNGELYFRAPGASRFDLWQNREVPGMKNQPLGYENPTSGDMKTQPLGYENPTSRGMKTQPLLVDGSVDGVGDLDGSKTNGNNYDGAPPQEETSEVKFDLINYLSPQVLNCASDVDFKYVKSSTDPEIITVLHTIQTISKQEFLPCKLPTDGTQLASKQLLRTIARLLSILKDTWDLPCSQSVWRTGSTSPISTFRSTVLDAAKHYAQRMAFQAEKPRNLHDWVYLEHRDPGSASSGLFYEISLMQKEREKASPTNERVQLAQRLTAAGIRFLDERLKPQPGGEKIPHPTAFWRRMLEWQDFMESRERDLRFHGALHQGWFRSAKRPATCWMLLQLFDQWKQSQGYEPTAWVPKIGEEEWDFFKDWLKSREGTELFVDLDFRSPLSQKEQTEALQLQEVRKTTETVMAGPVELDRKQIRESIVPEFPEISEALASYGDTLMRLHRASLVQRSVGRLQAAKALYWHVRHPPQWLEPDEEVPVALFAERLMVQVRDEWSEFEPELSMLGALAGIFKDLPDAETQA